MLTHASGRNDWSFRSEVVANERINERKVRLNEVVLPICYDYKFSQRFLQTFKRFCKQIRIGRHERVFEFFHLAKPTARDLVQDRRSDQPRLDAPIKSESSEMDGTLDPIRPSVVKSCDDEISYCYGRDPSILAFGQHRVPSGKQNLVTLCEDAEADSCDETRSASSNSNEIQTVKVFLRVKPFPRKHKLTKEESDAYRIVNSTTLLTKLPPLDATLCSVKGPKTSDSVCRKFTFTRTFGPETTQLKLFEEVIQPRMVDFLGGKNCTVMTYGTTGSGKSHTLQGTAMSPGIIPRGLEFVFSNINPRPMPWYKPIHSSDVVYLNAVERAQEIEAKNKLLTFASIDKHHYINAYSQMQNILQEESPVRPSQACDAHYSVWVSFAEIYNENIYDLLSNDCQKRRPLLKLAADNHDRAFIKGLKTFCVNSGSEAYQVLMAGQYNLKVAATALNAHSSRSHCIFTIQLLKYYAENVPESVEISTFTFCDLAGSERLKKTLNVGDRLKEAQNINTSLLVLGRCLKSIYEGQSMNKRQEHVGPFRESKLTRLFQRALSGKEQIALIVNINPLPNLYVETQNVLNFSAIAKRIVVEPRKIQRKVSNSRFSQMVAQSVRSNTDWDPSELCDAVEIFDATESESVFVNPEDYEDLLEENERLKDEISALKASMLSKDFQIRQEMTDTYTAMMEKMEADWKNRIKDVEAQTEENFEWRINKLENFYKDKLDTLASRKRKRTGDIDSDDDSKDIGELEIENSRLQTKVHSLKKSLKHFHEKNGTLLTEKNKLAFELGLANDELKSLKELLSAAQSDLCHDDESLTYVEQLRKQLSEKQERVKELKEFLNEAKKEYIDISSYVETVEDRLKDREEALAEAVENAADLKSLLDSTNACLEEKTRGTDILEDKVRSLEENLNEMQKAEEKHLAIQAHLEEKIRQLTEQVGSLEKSAAARENTYDTEIEIKKEMSNSEGDVSASYTTTTLPDGIFIKTDADAILEIPSSYDDNDRESEVFVQVQEIPLEDNSSGNADEEVVEIQAKLDEAENENKSLKTKLSRSNVEIQALKESLETTKEQLMEVTNRLKEPNDAQDLEGKAEGQDDSTAKKTHEQRVSLRNCESQTSKVTIVDGGNQTDAIVDQNKSIQTSFVVPIEEDKCVQTVAVENEELITKEKLLVELERKCSELEVDCNEKQLSIIMHTNKIAEVEKTFAMRTKEQEEKIVELNKCVERLEVENKQLEEGISERAKAMEQLNQRLRQADKRDEEKDTEIKMLQKSYKAHLAADLQDKKIHEEMKKTLKELLETKEALAYTDDLYQRLKISSNNEIESLEARISSMEKNAKQFEAIQQTTLTEKANVERLRTERDQLKAVLSEKELEMQSFMANRDKLIQQYETLVKSLQEDCERGRKEVTRLQEIFHRLPVTPRGKENRSEDEDRKDPIQLVELSDSETKKPRRRAALAPPPTEKKKGTRKKKLYTTVDDSSNDIEVCDAVPPTPSPSPSIRCLRNRKK